MTSWLVTSSFDRPDSFNAMPDNVEGDANDDVDAVIHRSVRITPSNRNIRPAERQNASFKSPFAASLSISGPSAHGPKAVM